MDTKLKRGFTYIELLIVMALIGIIGSFSLVINISGSAQSSVINERNQIMTLVLYKIRAEALANFSENDHGVHIDTIKKRYVVFTGSIFNQNDPNNISIPFQNQKLSVTTNPETDIIFKAVSGDVISSTTISIKNNKNESKIEVNNFGEINW